MPVDITPFSELAQVNPPRPALDLRDLDPVSFIPMSNVSESGRWTEQQSRPYGEVRRGYTYCAEGDVLFAKITPCTENGKGCHAIGLTNGVGFASTEFHVLRAKEGVDPRYIFQWSVNLSLRLNAAAQMTGSAGQRRVPAAFFDRFTVPKLSPPEQSKIADVLSTIGRAIEQTEALIAKHQRTKTGLMQDLLTRGIDKYGNLRSEQTHKFRDSLLGRIPAEWEVTKIGDQFVERKERGRTGLPVMSIVMNVGLVKRSLVDRRVETALTPEQHALVCEGDIAYNMMRMWQGVLGRASSDCLVSPAYVVLQPLESIDSRFAQWLFRDLRTVQAFCKASKGVVDDRLRLYPRDIFPIPIAMPKCLDEHTLIADRLDDQHKAIESSVRGLEKLHLLKRGLMHDLLTGNRRVTALLEPNGVTA